MDKGEISEEASENEPDDVLVYVSGGEEGDEPEENKADEDQGKGKRGSEEKEADEPTRGIPERDPNEPWKYIRTSGGDVHNTNKKDYPDYGFDFPSFQHSKEKVFGKQLKTEVDLFLYFIQHEESIPMWVDATNWNARRYFAKGKTSGVFNDEQYIDHQDMHVEGDKRKNIVC